jgi:hypothetical protein
MGDLLYRGVSDSQHRSGSALTPTSLEPFNASALFDHARFDVHHWDKSPINAALDHVEGLKRCGLSTSTHRDIALRFAADYGRGGWIYVLSRSNMSEQGVTEYDMQEFLPQTDKEWPDCEVILVREPPGAIDPAAVVATERVPPLTEGDVNAV